MLFFSERNKIAKMFEEWCKENNCAICSVNCITFLAMKGLLDENKIKEVIKGEENDK